ncbi:GNAT family N-acetyltransferase [Streptomyces sp. NPDC048641]|uniref:GNAT family N-acetyltransferase n=1 Tax=Streptomyces sp. NPDC048641 TaxID=3154825 RepID=UPI003421E29C
MHGGGGCDRRPHRGGPSCQGLGLGRELLKATVTQFDFRRITARTETEAVGFYRRCGFSVGSFGEIYRGVERFDCTLDVIRA